jgi:hypothetical protein
MKDIKELFKRFNHALKVIAEGLKYSAKARRKK